MAQGYTPNVDETVHELARSSMSNRTIRQQEPHFDKTEWNCKLCTRVDKRLRMIQCDSCDGCFHFRCVGLTTFDATEVWVCDTCKSYNEKHNEFDYEVCGICNIKGSTDMIQCTNCRVVYHKVCVNVEEVVQDWVCDGCREPKEKTGSIASSVKAVTVTSSINKRTQLKLDLLKQIKDVEEKVAIEELELLKKFLDDKRNRDLEFLYSKFVAIEGNVDNPEKTISSKSVLEEESAIDLIKKKRMGIWLSTPNLKNIQGMNADLEEMSQSSIRSDARSRLHTTNQGRIQPSNINQQKPPCRQETQHFPPDPFLIRTPQNNSSTKNMNVFQAQQRPLETNEPTSLTRQQISARQALSKDLPFFHGDSGDWPVFISAYENSTITCGYRNDENLIRLQKCLKDDAKKAVLNYLTFPDGVPRVIETLRMLFGNKETIFYCLLENIRKQPPPKPDNLQSIVDYSLSVQNLYGTIKSSGMRNEMNNAILIHELVDKLPPQIKLSWGIYKINLSEVTMKHLSDWLYELAKGACSVTTSRTKPQRQDHLEAKSETNYKDKRNSLNVHTTETRRIESTRESSSNYENGKKCCLCPDKFHKLNDCPDFKSMSSEQRWLTVKNHRMCRFCLGPHFYLKCKNRSTCGINGCEYKHHPKLHRTIITEFAKTPKKSNEREKIGSGSIVSKPASCNAHTDLVHSAALRYLPVKLYNGHKSIQVIAFLDEGATRTMVNKNIVEFLGIKSEITQDLLLKWTRGISRVEEDSQQISIEISGLSPNSRHYHLKNVNAVEDLDLDKQTMDVKQLASNYPYIRKIPAFSYFNVSAQMIIGLDNWKLGIPLKVCDRGWTEPVVTKTRLGWEIHGEYSPTTPMVINRHTGLIEKISADVDLHNKVLEFFSLENFGVKPLQKSLESKELSRSNQILGSTMKNIGDRYEVGLLWRYDKIELPDSYPMAISRFMNFERQLKMKPKIAEKVLEQMNGYVDKGYVQKLSDEEANIRTERTWYLPIFPKTYPKKPDKIRLVWDAAAKVKNISLNSMLLQGPDQTVSLVDVLRRFREAKVALVGDIKEMYHQVRIRMQDQDSQRFLWPSDDSKKRFDVYELKVMSFGATCSPSTAQHVKNQHALKYKEEFPRAVKGIINNHYVDDWLDRFDSDEDAIRVGQEVKRIHSKAGFEIRNWVSNSPEVIKALDGESKQLSTKINCDFESQTERILGMWWCVETDMFTYSLKYNPVNREVLTGNKIPTKREVLSTLMSIYDPLGFLASFLVYIKILLQDIWKSSIDWDEPIPINLDQRWKTWIKLLPTIERIRIPRHYSPKLRSDNQLSSQLHVFVDASELAYSAVAYLRIEDNDGVDVTLIGGKTKTAPLKPLSIPKVELQSFVLGLRFSTSIREGLDITIDRRCIWTDSATVLRWLRADHRKYNQFVGARIGEILESSTSPEWFWVPTSMNVADEATTWRSNPDLSATSRWFNGPTFLKEEESKWPKPTFEIRSEPKEELKKCFIGTHTQVTGESWIDVNVKEFSSFIKLLRVQVLVRRIAYKFMRKIRPLAVKTGPKTYEEYCSAERELHRKAQHDEYWSEIRMLKSGQKYVDRNSPIYKYSPYLDEHGVLRMKSRIDAAKYVSYDTKRPIILPLNHHITKLIILDYHERFVHQNHGTILNEIRQKFLIIGLRVFLRTTVPKICQFCKNKKAVPEPPQMADLPEARLTPFTRPFTFIGVDYAGPFYITSKRRTEKRWLMVFTCLVIRAIHIEIAHTLNTDSCIMCLRNFMNVRGRPQEIFSDNGTNLVGTENELSREIRQIDHSKLSDVYTNCYTKWNFNPPTAAHMGGVWERLIKSIKTNLYAVMPHRNPDDETFRCWILEIQNIINSRPLTYVPLDTDSEEALTPNHFLLGSSNGLKPPGLFTDEGLILRRNWRIAQQLTDNFWQRWIKEYLPVISRKSKWFEEVKPLAIGDIVIMVDEQNIRNSWPKGRIVETFEDKKSGQVRSVIVKTEQGTYKRPVHKLAILDVLQPREVVESALENSTEGRMLTTAQGGVVNPV